MMDHLSAYPRISSDKILKQGVKQLNLSGNRKRQFEDAYWAFDEPQMLYRYDDAELDGAFAKGSVWMRSMRYLACNYQGENKADKYEGQSILETGDNFHIPSCDEFKFGGLNFKNAKNITLNNCSAHTSPNPRTYCICLSTRCSTGLAHHLYPDPEVTVIGLPAKDILLTIREAILGDRLPLASIQGGHVHYSPTKKQFLRKSTGVCGNLLKENKFALESEYRITASFSESISSGDTLKLQVNWPKSLFSISKNAIDTFSRPYWFYKHIENERISCIPNIETD